MVVPFKPQKGIVYNHHLPYHHVLDEEALSTLAEIKYNLGQAVCFQELTPGILVWCNRLDSYLRMYGRNFSKEDHISFIKLLYELMITPELEPQFVKGFAVVLQKLLKKQELITRDDLVLDWRPLYDLTKSVRYSKAVPLGLKRFPGRFTDTISHVIKVARSYFSLESTKEMLLEWRPLLCPFDATKAHASYYFSHFLPTTITPEHHEKGFKLWFEELFDYWLHCTKNIPSVCEDYAKLFMRLAECNIGHINWNSKIPEIFNHFLSSLNLPINGQGSSHSKISVAAYAKWFIYMIGGDNTLLLDNLEKLFASLESFYHPSNHGRFSLSLLGFLHAFSDHLIQRLHTERFKEQSWLSKIPENYKITDEEIERIVVMVKDIALISVFSKSGSVRAASAIQNLSLLRPDLILPSLIERTFEALETLVEPHQVTATLTCITSVAKILTSGGENFPEAPKHVVPLLYLVLPGIDPNDFRKSMSAFTLISGLIGVIPLVDCMPAIHAGIEMSEVEHELCIASGQFEDYVLQFIDRCFALIENSTAEEMGEKENTNMETMNVQEGMLGMGLVSTVQTVLFQCSPTIFQSALDCMFTFVSTRVLEVNVAGKMVSDMVRSAAKAHPTVTLKKFLPFVCSRVKSLASADGVQEEEHVDSELLWYLEILAELVQCDGKELLLYKDLLKEIIRLTIHLKCKKAYSRSGKLLKAVLCSCTEMYPLEWYSQEAGFTKSPVHHFYIRDWGKSGSLDTLNIKWHLPNAEELEFINELLQEHLLYELDLVQQYMKGLKQMTRDDMHQHLQIIAVMIYGCGNVLPLLTGKKVAGLNPFSMVGRERRLLHIHPDVIDKFKCCVSRNQIATIIHQLLEFLLTKNEDDTKAFRIISKIYNCLLRHHGVNWNEFNMRWKSASAVKKALCDKLHGNKLHIRAILIERVRLQHDMRVLDRHSSPFTDADQLIVSDLLTLSLSDYAEVRMESQQTLFSCLEMFDYAARFILPKLLDNIKADSGVSHETLKGTLYILQYSRVVYLITHYWEAMVKAWPDIIKADYSEKPSIVMLLNKLTHKITSKFDSLSLDRKVGEQCIDLAKAMLTSSNPVAFSSMSDVNMEGSLTLPSKVLVEKAESHRQNSNKENKRLYFQLVDILVNLLEDKNLHWRTVETCLKLFSLLLDENTNMPINAVETFLNLQVHDSRNIRAYAMKGMVGILHQNKPKFFKKPIDYKSIHVDHSDDNLLHLAHGDNRSDNLFLQFDYKLKPTSQKDVDDQIYVEKTHLGYQTWPTQLMVYGNNTNIYSRSNSDLTKTELIILEKFSSDDFRDQFIKFLSMEHKKGEDRFDRKTYQLFKGIFRNYGNHNNLFDKYSVVLGDLLHGNIESKHRCASAIVAGMIRGSKNWSFEETTKVWDTLCVLLHDVFASNIIPEVLRDWTIALITATESLDPNRFHSFFKMLMDNPLSGTGCAFGDSSRIFILQNTLAQQEWRVAKLNHEMLNYLLPHLSHPFKNVRDQIGSMISYLFMFDLKYGGYTKTLSPQIQSFFKEITPTIAEVGKNALAACEREDKMEVDNDKHKEDNKSKDCYVKTVLVFLMHLNYHSMQPISKEIFHLIPLLVPLETREDDPELVQLCKRTFSLLACKQLPQDIIEAALEAILKVCRSASWNTRKTGLNYLKNMLFHNLFTFNTDAIKRQIHDIILERLQDEQLEVREIACGIFSGLVHYGYISIDNNLLKKFIKMSSRKVHQKRAGVELSPEEIKKNMESIQRKHGGVLGLSACILAYPYQVPLWMPEILLRIGDYLHEAPQIVATVKKTLSDFRRTHHDNWHMHRQKFTGDQLSVLTDLLVSPSYYA